MTYNKYDISINQIDHLNKPIFTFVNHKVATLCWAKIQKSTDKNLNVLHFDSHGDFRGGLVIGEHPITIKSAFGSKYITHLKHFSQFKDFIEWDMLNEDENNRHIKKEKKFFTIVNDNFIDIAFIKNIVSDVYWYFLNIQGDEDPSKKCEDINGKDHNFFKSEIKKIIEPSKPFILDIDLDFFVKRIDNNISIVPIKTLKKYISLQKKLFSSPFCKGMTIALEPSCCGGEDNCLSIMKELCSELGINLIPISKELINIANNS